ncbi:HBS1-like protein isoform X3 [Acanthaster planci]|uniref:HBS1-like protein isoform X3 n=1 Tax=Acanthaster planci TaxID=133434 RepID=A0A8B7Y661_ACAPL|nr:HBS1-like protein isoform X3 [Acanthaster planci]
MSRHRNVRGMDYGEDYEGYDDVYGHSVEDDYGVSPSTAEQFIYHRSLQHHRLASFLEEGEDDLKKEEEDSRARRDSERSLGDSANYQRPQLSDIEEAQLQSCLEEIRNVVGETVPERTLIEMAVAHSFNFEKALNAILDQQESGAGNNNNSQAQGGLGVAAQLPVKQPSPSRQKHMVPVAAATAMAANDTAVSAVAQEVAKLSMPSKEAKRGFELGPVPAKSGDKRRKSAASRTKLGGEFLDGMPDSNLRSESKGKLPTVMSAPDLTSMAGSPAPALPGAQPSTRRESKTSKAGNIDISKEYSKRQEGKQLINLVVIGHVDAGKSTLMGHLLYLLGQVNQRQMHKYEQESKKLGKASFAYAWVLDETGEERQRGITMDVGLTNFETSNRIVTLLDAPGHKDFIPNMITGAAQADVAIMVVDATRGEFETGFDAGGQTREHALLVRSLGVTQLAVAINKLDTVGWAEERFSEIVGKLGHFLKQAGFKESEVQYIPCSGLTGENLKDRATEPALTKWYKGPSLVERIDSLKAPKRPIEKAFRQCVSDVFKGIGAGISIAGKIESGGVQVGDRVVIMPAGETGQVRGVYIHDEESRWACAGDYATVVVTSIDQVNIGVGSVVCSIDHPIPVASRFRARVIMFNLDVPVTKGFPVLLHYQTVSEPAVICKLVSTLHKSTGEVLQKRPKCLTKQSNAIIDIETSRPVCLELYRDCKDLGRFMLRYSGSTIGAGVVTEVRDHVKTRPGQIAGGNIDFTHKKACIRPGQVNGCLYLASVQRTGGSV